MVMQQAPNRCNGSKDSTERKGTPGSTGMTLDKEKKRASLGGRQGMGTLKGGRDIAWRCKGAATANQGRCTCDARLMQRRCVQYPLGLTMVPTRISN